MDSYLRYIVDNWASLESGTYKLLNKRPKVTHTQLVTEEIVISNQPDLTKDDDLNTKLKKSVERIGKLNPKPNIGM